MERDECAMGLDDCKHTCENTIGSYKCGCKPGFELHSNERECEEDCGGIIEEENGTLTSPFFPNLYPSNRHCVWEIIEPPQKEITIKFTHFDLDGNNVGKGKHPL
ncbi:unnamed protein product [Orchesella dallaii]|uniref:Uncharacterized protein n=1 Tax=Orchesella dallaii TaxID=48710 RepID=A0ABP1RXR2_9HEXA